MMATIGEGGSQDPVNRCSKPHVICFPEEFNSHLLDLRNILKAVLILVCFELSLSMSVCGVNKVLCDTAV